IGKHRPFPTLLRRRRSASVRLIRCNARLAEPPPQGRIAGESAGPESNPTMSHALRLNCPWLEALEAYHTGSENDGKCQPSRKIDNLDGAGYSWGSALTGRLLPAAREASHLFSF